MQYTICRREEYRATLPAVTASDKLLLISIKGACFTGIPYVLAPTVMFP